MKQIALLGIQYDEKSSFLRGAALAPPLIREAFFSASGNMYTETGVLISDRDILDLGDIEPKYYDDIYESLQNQPTLRQSDPTQSHNHGDKYSPKNAQLYRPLISLGGDHSISYPLIRWHHEQYGAIDILHIDAHGDLYDAYEGDPHSHACPFARIMEQGLADRLIQVGVRSLTQHQRDQAQRFNVEQVEMKDYKLSNMPPIYRPIYLSLDLDVLDPAFAPGVSHHEPGGMSTRQLLDIIHSINVPIIGADIVEYNPTRDVNGMTAMVAAKCLKEIMAKMLNRK